MIVSSSGLSFLLARSCPTSSSVHKRHKHGTPARPGASSPTDSATTSTSAVVEPGRGVEEPLRVELALPVSPIAVAAARTAERSSTDISVGSAAVFGRSLSDSDLTLADTKRSFNSMTKGAASFSYAMPSSRSACAGMAASVPVTASSRCEVELPNRTRPPTAETVRRRAVIVCAPADAAPLQTSAEVTAAARWGTRWRQDAGAQRLRHTLASQGCCSRGSPDGR